MNFKSLIGSFVSGNSGSASHMKNLIEMAAADGHLHESEKALLKTLAKRYGISESHLVEIQNNPEKVELVVPRDESKKFQQLFELITMMGIDNHVHANETDLAKVLAIKFGYKPEIAGELVEVIRENIKNGSTVDETMKRAQLMIA